MKPKICVISGRYPETDFLAYINHKNYCNKKGYNYIYCNWPTKEKNKYLNKIHYLLEYIDLFDYVFWIDDDAFFIDENLTLEDYLPKNDSFLSICSSPKINDIFTVISSGQFFLKSDNRAKEFLNDILKTDMEIVKNWWCEDYGFFTNGDLDIMLYLMKSKEKYSKYDVYKYQEFNSRIEDVEDKSQKLPFILHITGKVNIKSMKLQKAMKLLDTDETLIIDKKSLSLKYRIKRSFFHKIIYKINKL